MKKLVFLSWAILLIFLASSVVTAARYYSTTAVLFPMFENRDVLVPDILVDTIRLPNKQEFDASRPVYVAYPLNQWLTKPQNLSKKMMEALKMIDGNSYWRARQIRGWPFIPCQLDDDNNPVCAKIEAVYLSLLQNEQRLKFVSKVNGKFVLYVE